MATIVQSSTPFRHSARAAAIVAGVTGVAAAAIILSVLGNPLVAGGFLAASLVLAGGIAAAQLVRQPTVEEASEIDWSIARTLAEASGDAIAITDRGGRLICANDAYRALFAGDPTPPNLRSANRVSQHLQQRDARRGAMAQAMWRNLRWPPGPSLHGSIARAIAPICWCGGSTPSTRWILSRGQRGCWRARWAIGLPPPG